MRNLKVIAAVAVLMIGGMTGWQVGSRTLANIQLQEDMHDLASQAGIRYGYAAPKSEAEFRDVVISKARQYDIVLEPSEVTVQRTGYGNASTLYLAADYSAPVKLPGYSFHLHFTPSSTK